MWKDAYEALEAAQVLFLRKFGSAMRTRAGSAATMLEMLTRLAGRLASQTRRSEESEHFQQFSTPLALGFVAAEAAALTPSDVVLEPSAGTGLLAIFAELAKAQRALNEIAETRAGLLGRLFRDVAGLCCKLPAVVRDALARGRGRAHAAASRSPTNWTASVSAHGPRPKARSTRRASPTMSRVRLKIAAWPLRSARITSKPLIVA